PELRARVDRFAVRRVIGNILHNAIKFTPPGGAVDIYGESQDQLIKLQFQDNGTGISDEDIPNLFSPFWQASTSRRASGGSGLGLYVCRRIVEAHKGLIECQSEPARGTIFTVTFP